MKKNYLLLIIIFFVFNLFSQEVTQRGIKRSKLYYHFQSYNENVDTAKKTAKQGLMSLISREVIEKDLKNISNVYIDNIKYLILPLEGETKVISYVLKTGITNDKVLKKELKIIEIKETKDTIHNSTKPTVNKPVTENKVKKVSVKEIKPIIKKNHSEVIINKPEPKFISTNASLNNEKTVKTIDRLIACNTDRELHKLLSSLNNEGKLRFNWDSKRFREKVSSQNYNIVLIDKTTKEVVTFYKKNSFKNLKNNTNINKSEFNKYIQVWIEMY